MKMWVQIRSMSFISADLPISPKKHARGDGFDVPTAYNHAYMYVDAYVYTHVYTHVHTHAYACDDEVGLRYVCIQHVHKHVHPHVYARACTHACTHVYTHACAHVRTCV